MPAYLENITVKKFLDFRCFLLPRTLERLKYEEIKKQYDDPPESRKHFQSGDKGNDDRPDYHTGYCKDYLRSKECFCP